MREEMRGLGTMREEMRRLDDALPYSAAQRCSTLLSSAGEGFGESVSRISRISRSGGSVQ